VAERTGGRHERGNDMRRRALLTGSAAGLAGAAAGLAGGFTGASMVTGAPSAAAATTTSLDWFDVMDYGATGNGSTDDTAAIQSALTAAAAGGGTVYCPAGQYLVTPTSSGPALSVGGNGIRLLGASSKASTLVKGASGVLLSISGPAADTTGATHRKYCSVEDLGFNGNGKTGVLLELYYNDNCYFRDVFMSSNKDICIDAVEFWDSRFYNLAIESSTGTAGSTTQPNIWLRNSSATSGWGYSSDNVNQIHFIGCRLEAFGTGGLWITDGTLAANAPNGIYLTDCKFETSSVQGGPHLWVDPSCRHVYATNIYCYSGGFASGYSTAQSVIVWGGIASALENVLIANGSPATVACGVDLYSGSGVVAVVRNVTGLYNTAPTKNHIVYEPSSIGDFRVENSFGSLGSQAGGTIPTKNFQNAPLRLVAGAVSDSSFLFPPLDGTLAIDSTDKRLYVRLGGAWHYAALT